MIERRSFIKGLISLVAAPAIVRVANIMPVKAMDEQFIFRTSLPQAAWRQINMGVPYGKSPAMTALADLKLLETANERMRLWLIRAGNNPAYGLVPDYDNSV